MPLQDSVKSLMNQGAISVLPDTLVLVAIDIILTNKFNGLPVTDKSGILVGILTKYDLIIKQGYIRDDTKVGEVMNKEPLVLSENMTVEDAITAFAEHHRVDPIPVINAERKVVGIISRYDMVKLFKEYGISPLLRQGPAASSHKAKNNVSWLAVGLALIAIVATVVYYFFF